MVGFKKFMIASVLRSPWFPAWVPQIPIVALEKINCFAFFEGCVVAGVFKVFFLWFFSRFICVFYGFWWFYVGFTVLLGVGCCSDRYLLRTCFACEGGCRNAGTFGGLSPGGVCSKSSHQHSVPQWLTNGSPFFVLCFPI